MLICAEGWLLSIWLQCVLNQLITLFPWAILYATLLLVYLVRDIYIHPFSDVTWAWWCLTSPATQVFVQQFVWANIKKDIRGSALLVLCEGNPPSQRPSNAESVSIAGRRHIYSPCLILQYTPQLIRTVSILLCIAVPRNWFSLLHIIHSCLNGFMTIIQVHHPLPHIPQSCG